jgi:hypothetical protein
MLDADCDIDHIIQRMGLTNDDIKRQKRRNSWYNKTDDELEPIFKVLSERKLPYGAVRRLSLRLNIKERTVRQWREKLIQFPEWRPYATLSVRSRVFSEAEERYLADFIRCNLLNEQRFCPRKGFLKRNGLAIRKPHLKRRPPKCDAAFTEFQRQMNEAYTNFTPAHIYNCDETSWHTVPGNLRTVANPGEEGVVNFVGADAKECTTAIATISAAGEKMPMWLICRGKTDRCERAVRTELAKHVHNGTLLVTHQPAGWCDGNIAIQYLEWLRSVDHNEAIVLIWDIYSAHRNPEVKAVANRLNITLIFIPPGMTDRKTIEPYRFSIEKQGGAELLQVKSPERSGAPRWSASCVLQPLDRRIFGSLKARAKSRWIAGLSARINKFVSFRYMMAAWKGITETEIWKAWAMIDNS